MSCQQNGNYRAKSKNVEISVKPNTTKKFVVAVQHQ